MSVEQNKQTARRFYEDVLNKGDEVTVRPIGDGEIIVAASGSRVRRHAGIANRIYRDGELDRLRDEWAR